MSESIEITIDLLLHLQREGYKSLLLRFGESVIEPRFENMEEIVNILNVAPMREDTAIAIEDAIEQYDGLEIGERTMVNIFNNY